MTPSSRERGRTSVAPSPYPKGLRAPLVGGEPASSGSLTKSATDRNELFDLAATGDSRGVRRSLAKGVDPNATDEDGTTPLMVAAFAGHAAVVADLLGAGANPDLRDVSGLTALTNVVFAVGDSTIGGSRSALLEVLALLLEAGADPGLEDQDGYSAIDHARLCRDEELLARLERR